MDKKVRVVLSKLGLDVHSRGVITVAKELRDAGMEVIYLGNANPSEIMNTALQEEADVVGVSSLGGAHLSLGKALLQEAEKLEMRESTVFLIGGVFSPEDGRELKRIGFDGVFPPGSTREKILSELNASLAVKKAAR